MSIGQSLFIDSSLAALPGEERMQWYAVHTRGRHEKKVAAQLMEKAIETFLPTIKEVHHWSDRKKIVEVPLFPSYTFVRMPDDGCHRLAVLQTEGVVRIVSYGENLAAIEPKQVEDIRTLLASGVPMTMHPFLKLGARVRVRGGCLDGLEGIFVSRPNESTLVITVDAIQRSIAIDLAGYQVEPA